MTCCLIPRVKVWQTLWSFSNSLKSNKRGYLFQNKRCTFVTRNDINKLKILCMRTLNFTTGGSDCHNMISTVITNTTSNIGKTRSTFRSFRNFDNGAFLEEIANIQLSNSNIHTPDQVNTVYNRFENNFVKIIGQYVPIKTVIRKKRATPIYV